MPSGRNASFPAALFAALLACSAGASAAPEIRSVSVDTGILAATVGPAWAGIVRASLQPALRDALAGRVTGGRTGLRVIVRLKDASLSENAYGGIGRSRGGFNAGGGVNLGTDNMDGDILVLGPNGRVVESIPLRAAPNADSGGAWYTPGFEQRRLDALSAFYASWVKRKLDE